jgi:hypothetical protein
MNCKKGLKTKQNKTKHKHNIKQQEKYHVFINIHIFVIMPTHLPTYHQPSYLPINPPTHLPTYLPDKTLSKARKRVQLTGLLITFSLFLTSSLTTSAKDTIFVSDKWLS